MTPPAALTGRQRQIASAKRTMAAGRMMMPGKCRSRQPGWILVRVKTVQDGRVLDHIEAAVLFSDQPWKDDVRYLGSARSYHVWERPPVEVK